MTDAPKPPQNLKLSKLAEGPGETCGSHATTASFTAGKGHGHSHSSHSHAGGHGHSHAAGASRENIRFAFYLNAIFSVIELLGGLWFGSFAVVANALHDVGDSMSLGAAWFLEGYANRKQDSNFNFGYRRFSLLSALIAGVVIATGNILIIIECVHKLFLFATGAAAPAATSTAATDTVASSGAASSEGLLHLSQGASMIAIGAMGLAMNTWAAIRLSQGNTQNEKMLTWHSIEDILGWSAVLVGGLIVQVTKINWLDPLLAMGLAIFVSYNVWAHLKTTIYLFLQGRPADFNEDLFSAQVLALQGVDHMDHLAVWSLDGVHTVLSARIHIHSTHDPELIETIKQEARSYAKLQNAEATLETCLMTKADQRGDSC